jgi:hypothetical protein
MFCLNIVKTVLFRIWFTQVTEVVCNTFTELAPEYGRSCKDDSW